MMLLHGHLPIIRALLIRDGFILFRLHYSRLDEQHTVWFIKRWSMLTRLEIYPAVFLPPNIATLQNRRNDRYLELLVYVIILSIIDPKISPSNKPRAHHSLESV